MAKKQTAERNDAPEPRVAESGVEGKKPPVEIRVGTALVKIWTNEGERGPWHNVTVANLYREEETWKQGQSFGRNDLPNLIEALEQAHRRLQGITVSTPEGDQITRTHLGVAGQTKVVIDRGEGSETA